MSQPIQVTFAKDSEARARPQAFKKVYFIVIQIRGRGGISGEPLLTEQKWSSSRQQR